MHRLRKNLRRGVSATQTAIVLVAIIVATVAVLRTMGTATSTQLDVTSEGLVDPAALRSHFSGDGN